MLKWLFLRRRDGTGIKLPDNQVRTRFTKPRVHLVGDYIFLTLMFFVVLILFDKISRSFLANPVLNGLIVFVIVLGIIKSIGQLLLINREIDWIESIGLSAGDTKPDPSVLIPLARYLRRRIDNREPLTMPAEQQARMLASIAGRLDDDRTISRYMTGLLIFLGLLGTFWGLLETVASVGDVVGGLDIKSKDTGVVFDSLRSGLQAPLSGMAIAFASSLFGLSGSLVLGFLDLQSGKGQSRFLDEVEEFVAVLGEKQNRGDENNALMALQQLP